MTKEELLKKLELLQGDGDTEAQHYEADKLIMEYVDDKEIKEAYDLVDKWYA